MLGSPVQLNPPFKTSKNFMKSTFWNQKVKLSVRTGRRPSFTRSPTIFQRYAYQPSPNACPSVLSPHPICTVVSTPKVYSHKYTDLESISRYHLSTDVLCHVTVDLLGVPADGAQEVGGRHRSQKWHRRPTGT